MRSALIQLAERVLQSHKNGERMQQHTKILVIN